MDRPDQTRSPTEHLLRRPIVQLEGPTADPSPTRFCFRSHRRSMLAVGLETSRGPAGAALADANPFLRRAPGCEHFMSSFEQGPQDGKFPDANGPVLVMAPRRRLTRWEIWRRRIFLVIFVLFCLEIGILLTVAPWTQFWTHNSLLVRFPEVRRFLMYGFVRGLISGLGLTDIWLAVAEAIRYREPVV